MRLSDHAVVITGAGGGIGRAVAVAFAADGAAVIAADLADKADAVAEEIRRAGGRAVAVSADVSQSADMSALAARSVQETNWERIVRLYDLLFALRPSPVVALNRAIALGELRGPEQGLSALEELGDRERLAKYPFLPAAQGRLHLKAGRSAQAAECFNRALVLARNPSEARLFDARLREATSAA